MNLPIEQEERASWKRRDTRGRGIDSLNRSGIKMDRSGGGAEKVKEKGRVGLNGRGEVQAAAASGQVGQGALQSAVPTTKVGRSVGRGGVSTTAAQREMGGKILPPSRGGRGRLAPSSRAPNNIIHLDPSPLSSFPLSLLWICSIENVEVHFSHRDSTLA